MREAAEPAVAAVAVGLVAGSAAAEPDATRAFCAAADLVALHCWEAAPGTGELAAALIDAACDARVGPAPRKGRVRAAAAVLAAAAGGAVPGQLDAAVARWVARDHGRRSAEGVAALEAASLRLHAGLDGAWSAPIGERDGPVGDVVVCAEAAWGDSVDRWRLALEFADGGLGFDDVCALVDTSEVV